MDALQLHHQHVPSVLICSSAFSSAEVQFIFEHISGSWMPMQMDFTSTWHCLCFGNSGLSQSATKMLWFLMKLVLNFKFRL